MVILRERRGMWDTIILECTEDVKICMYGRSGEIKEKQKIKERLESDD